MFSRESSFHPTDIEMPDTTVFIENTFTEFLEDSNLCAGIFCIWDEDRSEVLPIVSSGIPLAPFKGSKKEVLNLYIQECLERHPAPHLHAIVKDQLWKEISSIKNVDTWQTKALFIPAYIEDMDFVAICFSDQEKLSADSEIVGQIADVVQVANFILSAERMKNRLDVMEIYIREIGHDIASSVQAIIAKLRNISRGLIQGPAVKTKVKEAEEEIMATYRVADTLGITVDPDYNVGTGADFNAVDILQEVVNLCLSEAAERHIELRTDYTEGTIELWGDYKAIQSALMQLVINAIKYAKGSTFVTIRLSSSREAVEFSVTDVGMSISPDDKFFVWDFGWRGERAKEQHVNGSGIGLYTVKKIVSAHGGSVNLNISGENSEVITFLFRIPKKKTLKKYFVSLEK